MNTALKHCEKVCIFLLFWNLKQMAVCQMTQVADVGSAQRWKKSFSVVSKEWEYTLTEEEFSFTIRYQYYSTEVKQFSWSHYIVLQKNSVPQTFDGCNDLPICRNTKTGNKEIEISLQVSWALQTHRVGVLSKLRKVDRKGGRSQDSVLIISLYFLIHMLGCIHHHQFSYFLIPVFLDNLYMLYASSHFSFCSSIWTEVYNKAQDACQH